MLSRSNTLRTSAALTGTVLMAASLAACASASGESGGNVEVTVSVYNEAAVVKTVTALAEAFQKENPNVTVTVNPRPTGTEGDNLVKTQLSTGEMDSVLLYNSGSLFQALNPDQTLTDLSDQSWAADVASGFKPVVSTDSGFYGAPLGTSYAGAVVYNKKVFADLGIDVPKDWASFKAAAEKIKAAGITPVEQTYGDSWTSQLFVLGDFGNILTQDPQWAEDYTANKAKYADEPALSSFQHLQDAFDAGMFNQDFASATLADGIAALGSGKAAMYPMLTQVVLGQLAQDAPDQIADLGVFPFPADAAADTTLTVWQPSAMYIPKTTEGAELDAAKNFVAFANSSAGCDIQNDNGNAAGPYVIDTCKVPSDAAPLVADIASYVDGGASASALEFLSPIKGPNLENISVEVGSGIRSAADGAAAYDEDVKKQAQQLGIEGW
ncbi:extracellular solute-binding protein [Microbacterium sp. NPDC089180]|uniref:ABC transporter substrate-binding protein n=1 Tax=unclassified Microbacterium TaxID=2609290 RepID=UPI003444E173